MTNEQFNQVEESFSCGDCLVFKIGERVFVTDTILKHPKQGTIEFQDCNEIDESCFESNGEYYGETLLKTYNFIIADPYADNENQIATIYYNDEIEEEEEIK